MESRIVNDRLELIKRDDQIFIYKALDKCNLDEETMTLMAKVGDEMNGGDNLCANLIDIRKVSFIDSKARAKGAKEYRPHVAGMAILVDSKISSYFANLFLKFSKPKTPTRLFSDEDEAIVWLKDQMAKRK